MGKLGNQPAVAMGIGMAQVQRPSETVIITDGVTLCRKR